MPRSNNKAIWSAIEKLEDSFNEFKDNEIKHLQKEVTENRNDIKWIKEKVESIDKRQWYIVTGIIISIITTIALNTLF